MLQTEYEFTLPKGYIDVEGNQYLKITDLSSVVTRLGELERVQAIFYGDDVPEIYQWDIHKAYIVERTAITEGVDGVIGQCF